VSDWERFTRYCRHGQWGKLALAITANVAVVSCLIGLALLTLRAGIYALDWLGALPCLCS